MLELNLLPVHRLTQRTQEETSGWGGTETMVSGRFARFMRRTNSDCVPL